MRWRPAYDPRESPKHRALLETRSSLGYLPYALRWAMSPSVISMALIYGSILGFFSGFLFGMWLVILLGSGAIAWLLAVQARAVFGFGDPPQPSTEELTQVGVSAIQVMILVALLVGGYGALRTVGEGTASTFAWVVGVLLPSVFVLLAVEDSLFEALKPGRLLRVLVFGGPIGWLVAAATGWGLEALLSFLVELVGQPETAVAMISHAPNLTKVGGTILVLWAGAMLLHLNGHALHHRHDAAGLGAVLEAATEDELAERSLEKSITQRLDAIQRIVMKHDPLALEQVCTRAPPDGIDALGFYHGVWQELLFHKQFPAAVRVAKVLLGEAVGRKRYPLATEIWIEARRLSPSFDLGEALMSQFISMAEAHGDKAMVARLVGKAAQ